MHMRLHSTKRAIAVIGASGLMLAAAAGADAAPGTVPLVRGAVAGERLAPELRPHSTQVQETVMYNFGAQNAGRFPEGNLTALNGSYYGATIDGGNLYGTIYAASSTGVKVLYAFKGSPDGALPAAGVTAVNGMLYGTTTEGGYCNDGFINGSHCYGTVFQLSPSGEEKVLFKFNGTDGGGPHAQLVYANGALFGTTANGRGTVFEVTLAGAHRTLHSFMGGTDGENPYGSLLFSGGEIYGTTALGGGTGCGGSGCGSVFAINATTGQERVVYAFQGGSDGAAPVAGLTAYAGKLYGTTYRGGNAGCLTLSAALVVGVGCGTVYSISPSGAEQVVYRFGGLLGVGGDGTNPATELTMFENGLYGTTEYGGSYLQGTVFAVNWAGNEAIMHSFAALNDGQLPLSPLLGANGTLMGATSHGGLLGLGGGTLYDLKW
jgi:uncharacterized repeat protein (TIGR03803 family)